MPRVEVVSKMMVVVLLLLLLLLEVEVENMLVVVNLVVRMNETSLS